MISCDYEIIGIENAKVGDWVQLSDGVFSLIVADMTNSWQFGVAEFDTNGVAHFMIWQKDGFSTLVRVPAPVFEIGSIGAVTTHYESWSTPLALTQDGLVLRMINVDQPARGPLFHNLQTRQGTSSQPGLYAPVKGYTLWASEAERLKGTNPLVQYAA